MNYDLKGRSLLTLNEFSSNELEQILRRGHSCKQRKKNRIFEDGLKHRNICGIFLKPSGRTSSAFVVATNDEGGHLEFFSAENIRFGYKESVEDLASFLGRMFDGIAFRGFDHEVAEKLAAHSQIPVWNCLTDEHHPTQLLADAMTMQEEFGSLDGLKVVFVGDGNNNVATSLMIGALKLGYNLHIVGPSKLYPSKERMNKIYAETTEQFGTITMTENIKEGVLDADVIYNDVWVSMGDESKTTELIDLLHSYKITSDIMIASGKNTTIYMHCLPAFHDLETEIARKFPDILEVDDDVFKGAMSRVFDQAENRMHAIKALMLETIG
ncbi:MAG: ornithine carbamoyltransferase [Pseudomonadales bacterium]|nr:ornithine carbamoyltransferase [Pseudomonadales bacterium]